MTKKRPLSKLRIDEKRRTQRSFVMKDRGKKAGKQAADRVVEQLRAFVGPIVEAMDERLDKRLVRTFEKTLAAIMSFRHSTHGLLLSELGAYITSPAHAPAGTKRLSNLLRSTKWGYELIAQFLWNQAKQRMAALKDSGQEGLLVWDDSILEKAESIALEGLCAVRSSVAARLKRIKPGYFNPPGGKPVFVPGLNWLSVLLLGMSGPPTVVAMDWWTSRGKFASDKGSRHEQLLTRLANEFGQQVIHVFDRGFAGASWLSLAFQYPIRFVVRWPKAYKLLDTNAQLRKAWKIAQGKRSWQHDYIFDARRRVYRKVGFLALQVAHPDFPHFPLWLVVSRQDPGRQPWYLLTNEPIFTDADAWHIILVYARRWQIEMAYRYAKSDLAFEAPRLWFWHNRLNLLWMATLVYAFLLSLLEPACDTLRFWLLRHFCHRTGKRSQVALTPLYRLRSAISRLWLAFEPSFQNSG
jgi:hypothetical protein